MYETGLHHRFQLTVQCDKINRIVDVKNIELLETKGINCCQDLINSNVVDKTCGGIA